MAPPDYSVYADLWVIILNSVRTPKSSQVLGGKLVT
jgi:hypothetical protein